MTLYHLCTIREINDAMVFFLFTLSFISRSFFLATFPYRALPKLGITDVHDHC